MPYTKRDIINQAHGEIGLGTYAYDAQPEDLQDALMRLNAIMGEWASAGAGTGWPSVNAPLMDDLDADSNLPIDAVQGVVCALAVAIAPAFGKTPMPDTIKNANRTRRLMQAKNANVPTMAMDIGMAQLGAGWKSRDLITLPDTDDDILQGQI